MNNFDSFVDATVGGLLLFAIFWSFWAIAAKADEPKAPPTCEQVLGACDRDVEKLKAQVIIAKDDVKFWKKQAQSEDKRVLGCVTAVALGGAAGGLGGVAANGKQGLAPGGIVGAVTGLVTCLLVQ